MSDTPETTDTTMPPQQPQQSLTASEREAIDGLLRWQLGRRMTICLLALAESHAADLDALARRLTSIAEAQVLPFTTSAEEGLRQAARQDAEIVLLWLAVEHEDERTAAANMLERADELGLRDRSFVALIGPAMTRDLAHRMRFEDGFPATIPTAQLLWSLAREAIARDELRRRGSSPPCYL